jgi:RNA polymerase sigma-70 factor, ECF subfamily
MPVSSRSFAHLNSLTPRRIPARLLFVLKCHCMNTLGTSKHLTIESNWGSKMKSPQTTDPQDPTQITEFSKQDQPCASELPEKQAVTLAQRGDAFAFERLYQLHSARVYALCLRMTGNAAEAEDLMQEVFLMVFRKIGTFRGDSAFSTWLHRIAVNLTLMRLRRKTSMETSLQETGDPEHDRPGHLAELAVTDLRLSGSLDRLHLERAMQKLCPFQMLVVVLHDIQGYKHNEIAKMLDWSIGNSKSRLHRARARLRMLLQESLRFDCITPSRTAHAAFVA